MKKSIFVESINSNIGLFTIGFISVFCFVFINKRKRIPTTKDARKNTSINKHSDPISVEQSPQFSKDILEWVMKNIRYPEEAKLAEIQGRVIVQFHVDGAGNIVDPIIKQGVEESLNQEVLRVIREIPDFLVRIPHSSYSIPIQFVIQ